MNKNLELTFYMDPHCGRSYGFGTEVQKIYEKYKNDPNVSFDVKPGRLYYPAINLDADSTMSRPKKVIDVEKGYGVVLSEKYVKEVLEKNSFLDSEPGSRAILTLRELNKSLAFPFAMALLKKEFEEGLNNTLEEVIIETLSLFEVDLDAFKKLFDSEKMKHNVQLSYQEVRETAKGLPVLMMEKDNVQTKLPSGGINHLIGPKWLETSAKHGPTTNFILNHCIEEALLEGA